MADNLPIPRTAAEASLVPPETVLEVCLCHMTRRAARAISRAYDKAFAAIDLTANQFTLLAAVAAGPVSIGELESMLVMEASTLSRNLSVLRRAGYLTLEGHGGRRAGQLALTATGHDQFTAAMPLWQQVQADLTARLGTGRASLLVQSLEAASFL